MLHSPGSPYALPPAPLSEDATFAHAHEAPRGVIAWLKDVRAERAWRWPALVFALAFALYAGFAGPRVLRPSDDIHFVYLANTYASMIAAPISPAAAQRRADKAPFELDRLPPHQNDWANYWELGLRDGSTVRGIWTGQQGHGELYVLGKKELIYVDRKDIDPARTHHRFYVSFPPGPAFLMTPLVPLLGYKLNDVLFTIFFAALNVALLFSLLERASAGGRSGRSRRDNLWLTLLFAASTAHFTSAILGQVWFTALIVGCTCTLVYLRASIDARHPLLAGCALALAFASRTPLLFTAVFFGLCVAFPGGHLLRRDQIGWAMKKIAWFALPCLTMGIALLIMNKIRFDSYGEFGHSFLAGYAVVRARTYGLFHPIYISRNLTAMFTLIPQFSTAKPHVLISRHGLSLLLTSPAFVYLLKPMERLCRQDVFWYRALWITVALCVIPGICYQNTGYEQFGFRFSLDYTAYLMLLLAMGRHPITRAFKASILAGVLVNMFGAVTFKRFQQFYTNDILPRV
jgi:hypothetical protein